AGVAGAVVLAEVVLTTPGRETESLLEGERAADYAVMRAACLLLMGALLGYLAEQEGLQRAGTAALARIAGKAQPEAGLRAAVGTVLDEVFRLFEAPRALIVMEETASGRVFLWEAKQEGPGLRPAHPPRELGPTARSVYLFDFGAAAQAWYLARGGAGARLDLVALDADGHRLRQSSFALPDPFAAAHGFRCLLAASFAFA